MAELKITDLVDQSAIDGLKNLSKELQAVKEQYEVAARKMLEGLKIKVEFTGDVAKLNSILSAGAKDAEQATVRLNNAIQQQNKIVAQTTNTISRELAEIEKENAKKREAVQVNQAVADSVNQTIGSLDANIVRLAKMRAEMEALKKEQKDGNITSAEFLSKERELKIAMQELNGIINNQQKLANAAAGSYQHTSLQLELYKKAYKGMTDEEKRSTAGMALAEEIQNLDAALKDAAADMGEFQRNTGNYAIAGQSVRAELKQLVTEIASLTVMYKSMSDEERNSAEGDALKKHIDEITERAGMLKDAMLDTTEEIKHMASDTKGIDQIAAGIELLADGYGVAEGAAHLLGLEEEDLAEVQAKMQSIMVVTNGLTKIQNALQSESAVMLGIRTIKEKAASAAIALKSATESKSIVVSKAATVAQTAFNAVANANPYVLLATALVTVVGALAAFAIGSNEAAKEQENFNQAAETNRAIMEAVTSAKEDANKSTAEEMVKVTALHDILKDNNADYVTRKQALDELKKRVPNYHGSLTREGKLINDNTSSIDKYVKHLSAMAAAQAYMNKMTEVQTKVLNAQDKAARKRNNMKADEAYIQSLYDSGAAFKTEMQYSPGGGGRSVTVKTRELAAAEGRLAENTREYNAALKEQKQAQVEVSAVQKQMLSAMKQGSVDVNSLLGTGGGGSRSHGGGGTPSGRGSVDNLSKEDPLRISLDSNKRQLEVEEKYTDKWLELVQQRNQLEHDISIKATKLRGANKQKLIDEEDAILEKKNQDAIEERNKFLEDAEKKRIEDEENIRKQKLEKLEQYYAAQQAIDDTAYQKQLAALKRRYADGEITEEQYNEQSAVMAEEYAVKKAKAAEDYYKGVIGSDLLTEEEREDIERKLADATADLENARADAAIAANKRIEENDDKLKQKRLENAQAYLQKAGEALGAINDLTQAIFDGKIANVEKEEEVLGEQYEADKERIQNLNDAGVISKEEADQRMAALDETKAAKEAEIEEKKKKIKEKQAKVDKANSIVQATISTALAVMNALSTVQPFPAAIAMAAIAGAMGAIQIATIAAQPLPKYAKGTDSHKGGYAIVGDGGKQELVTFGGNAYVTPDTPTLVNLPRGAKVHPDALDVTGLNPFTGFKSISDTKMVVNPTNVRGIEQRTDETNRLLKMQLNQERRLAYDMNYRNYKTNRL